MHRNTKSTHYIHITHSKIGPDRLESIILKIIGNKIDNLPCHLQSIIPDSNSRLMIGK